MFHLPSKLGTIQLGADKRLIAFSLYGAIGEAWHFTNYQGLPLCITAGQLLEEACKDVVFLLGNNLPVLLDSIVVSRSNVVNISSCRGQAFAVQPVW